MWDATGAKTWDDAINPKEVIFGSTARGTGAYVNQAILRNVRHARPPDHGLSRSAEQRLGIERGELTAIAVEEQHPRARIRDKKINAFVRLAAEDA